MNVSFFFFQSAIKFCKHSLIFRWEDDTQMFTDYNTEREDSCGIEMSVYNLKINVKQKHVIWWEM